MGLRYTHQAITTEQQIDILKERGLLIDDVKQAVKVLDTISYFRLAGYWRHFEADQTTHQFKKGSCFADIVSLYSFDKQLRALLFTAIQTIEVSVRTKIIKHFALEFDAFWFMDETLAVNKTRFKANLEVIRKEVARSHDDFIAEHFRKYSEPDLPPVWKTLEVTSFGLLSKLYCNLNDNRIKKQIARQFNLPQHQILESWIKCAVLLRNCIAHHARIWNRRFPQMPQLSSLKLRGAWVDCSQIKPIKLYAQLCCLAYLQDNIHPDNDFKANLKSLLNEYPCIDLHAMGFPDDWEKQPLWR